MKKYSLIILLLVPLIVFGAYEPKVNQYTVAEKIIGTTPYVVLSTDYMLIVSDTCTVAKAITLPTPVGITGRRYSIKNTSHAIVTITPAAGLIDSNATYTLTVKNVSLYFISDGANWNVFGTYIMPPTPHLTVADTIKRDLTPADTAAVRAVIYNKIEDQQGINYTVGDSGMFVNTNGEYAISLSTVVGSTSNANVTISLWFVRSTNGGSTWVDIDRSATSVVIPNTTVNPVVSLTFIIDLNKGDGIMVRYNATFTNNNGVASLVNSAKTNRRPLSPSTILSICKIGR